MSVTFLGNFGKFNDAIVPDMVSCHVWVRKLEHCSTAHRSVKIKTAGIKHSKNTKLSYCRDSARSDDVAFKHSRSLKVIRCCANRRAIYDFLLALDSNLTSIFNRSWDITPSLHIYTPKLFQVQPENTAGSRWICFGIRVPRTSDYPIINLNPR